MTSYKFSRNDVEPGFKDPFRVPCRFNSLNLSQTKVGEA